MSASIVLLKPTAYNYNLYADFISDLASGETVSSATASAVVFSGVDASPSALLLGSPSVSGSVATQVLKSGTSGVVYLVTMQATTSAANILVRTFLVSVEFSLLTATDSIVTTLGGNPVAAFTSVVTGLSIAFTDTSTDPGGSISAWAWNFGDSTTSAVQNPTHVYTATGDFIVTLIITDSYSGKTSNVNHTVTIAAAASGVVSPPGYASPASYNTTGGSKTSHATAKLTFTIVTNGTWNIVNKTGSVIASGNWYYPNAAGIGASYQVKFTPTLSVTGSYWTLTNPAAAATTISSNKVLILSEDGTADDSTIGTVKVDITPVAAGGTSTGTFSFSVNIATNLNNL